jgi:hypothetical protein
VNLAQKVAFVSGKLHDHGTSVAWEWPPGCLPLSSSECALTFVIATAMQQIKTVTVVCGAIPHLMVMPWLKSGISVQV